MIGDGVSGFVYGLLLLVLVGSGLAARRLPLGQSAKMALAWVLIFGVGFAIFTLRDDFRALGRRMAAEVRPERGRVVNGTLRIPMAEDGHFWVEGSIGGRRTRFLVDSGATTTALTSNVADAGGVTVDRTGFRTMLSTANGPVEAQRATIADLRVGPIRRAQLAAVTAPEFGDTSVLGMNFLSSLSSWGVQGRDLMLKD